MLRQIGPTELIIVLVIVIIIFGVGRLGEVGGAIGKGIREFRKATSGEDEEKPKAVEASKAAETPKDAPSKS